MKAQSWAEVEVGRVRRVMERARRVWMKERMVFGRVRLWCCFWMRVSFRMGVDGKEE